MALQTVNPMYAGPADVVEVEMEPGKVIVVTATQAAQMLNAKYKKAAMYSSMQQVFYAPKEVVPETDIRKALVTAKERLARWGWARTWVTDNGNICLGTALNLGGYWGIADRVHSGEAVANPSMRVTVTAAEQMAQLRVQQAIHTTDIPTWNDRNATLEMVNGLLDKLIFESTQLIEREAVTA